MPALPRRDEVRSIRATSTWPRCTGDGTIYLKGAVEKILERCSGMLGPEGR